MDRTQFLTHQELITYESLDAKLDYEALTEVIDLLDIENYKSDILSSVQPFVIEELQKQKQEQEQEIARLQSELKNEEEIDINQLMSSLQIRFNDSLKKLFETLEVFLKEFNSNSNVLPISKVQEYTSTDEQLSRLIIQYSKQVEEVIQAIDFSVHHHCLMSDRAEEYTDLCADRMKLQSLSLKNLEQEVKTSAAKQRYEAAMQALEDIVLREQKDKFLQEEIITSRLSTIKQELEGLNQQNNRLVNEDLNSVVKQLAKLQAEENLLESHNELADKRCEYESLKLQEVIQLLDEQKKKHLLAMAGILLEQEKVQSEYDCLFEIKTFLEDIKAQADFRIDHYKAFRSKHELEIGERKTVDQRDTTLNELYQSLEKQSQEINITYDKLTDLVTAVLEKRDNSTEIYHSSIEAILESTNDMLDISERVLDSLDVVRNSKSMDGGRSYLSLLAKIKEQEQKLNKIMLEVEQTRMSIKTSPSGLTERGLFVDFLTTSEDQTPKYYLDCEDLI